MTVPKVEILLALNDAGYTAEDENELKQLLSGVQKVEVARGMQCFPIASNVFFVIIVSGVLGGIAGGLLQAIGADLWTAIKSGLTKFFSKRKHHIHMDLHFDNCWISVPVDHISGGETRDVLDQLDSLTADVQRMIEKGQIPEDGFYLQLLTYVEEQKRWVVTSATNKACSKDYRLDLKTQNWSVTYRKDALPENIQAKEKATRKTANNS